MSAKPITPKDVATARVFPDAVIEAFNECVVEAFDGHSATVLLSTVAARIAKKGISKKVQEAKGYLNVEGLYRVAGWTVVYDQPGYNEEGEGSFCFTKKGK